MKSNMVRSPSRRFSLVASMLLASASVVCAQGADTATGQWQRKPPIQIPPAKMAKQFFLSGSVRGASVLLAGVQGVAAVTDRGLADWRQIRVPHDVALTSTCLTAEGAGLIGGHEGTLLYSGNLVDWIRTSLDQADETILLALYCGPGKTALAVGTFGAVYRSVDGGRTWEASGPLATAEGLDPHFYSVRRLGSGEFLIVGEEGAAFQSTDDGASWQEVRELAGPSLFGLIESADGTVYAHGIEGRLIYRDKHRAWHPVPTGTRAALLAAARVSDEVLLAGEDGVWLTVRQGAGESIVSPSRQLASRATVMGVIESGGEAVFLTRTGLYRLGHAQLQLSAAPTHAAAGVR